MRIRIKDDLDLDKIINSGQCFRNRRLPDGWCRFITGDHVLSIREDGKDQYRVSCDEEEWDRIWTPYFDLSRSYRAIAREEHGKHPFIDEAIDHGRGLRILRQDPWETLLSFIISQRKSIPAIAKTVEALADKYGHTILTDRGPVRSFPTAKEMEAATEEELSECGTGYRTKYIIDAIQQANSGSLDLEAIAAAPDDFLIEELRKVYGVGKKVADCVALFAYGRLSRVPVDVWIARAIDDECEGRSPFSLYGENAGIIQQYVFYYERGRGGKTDQKKRRKK